MPLGEASRPLLYMGIGALAVATVIYAPSRMGPLLHHVVARLHLSGGDHRTAHARALYASHAAAFRTLADLVEQCRGTGLVSLYPDGRSVETTVDTLQCAGAAAIARQLAPLGFEWVNIEGRTAGRYGATFVMQADPSREQASRDTVVLTPDPQGGGRMDPDGHWVFVGGR